MMRSGDERDLGRHEQKKKGQGALEGGYRPLLNIIFLIHVRHP
jgi:hypothetical protein